MVVEDFGANIADAIYGEGGGMDCWIPCGVGVVVGSGDGSFCIIRDGRIYGSDEELDGTSSVGWFGKFDVGRARCKECC